MTRDELTYEGQEEVRLDRFLSEVYPSLSRNYFEKVISKGHVLVNHKPSKKSQKLQPLDEIFVDFPPLDPLELSPVKMDIPVYYEDEDLALVYKPPKLVSHPAAGTHEPTLIHGLLYRFLELQGLDSVRPGLVHRLDKDTSGIMVIAKNLHTHELLSNQFRAREVKKTYLALVHRSLERIEVNAQIGRSLNDRKKMSIQPQTGKEASTLFIPISSSNGCTLVKALPKTGRTHQIRVHLQHIHHPIVGDPLYGFFGSDKPLNPPRILLHAYNLEFIHPHTKKLLSFSSPLPPDFSLFLERMGFDNSGFQDPTCYRCENSGL
jgi:23S rRNA pseudouridine1911/1915/1917 synthase